MIIFRYLIHIFGFHYWYYEGEKDFLSERTGNRICLICGKKEEYHFGVMDYWED